MTYLFAIAYIVGGFLAAAALMEKLNPNAKQLVDKISPFKLYIGLVVLAIGLWSLIYMLIHGHFSLASVAGILCGALLASEMAGKLPSIPPEKRDQIVNTLKTYQIPIGVVTLVLGFLFLLAHWVHIPGLATIL